jgi:hypothetical protein
MKTKLALCTAALVFGFAGSATAQWLQFAHDAAHNGADMGTVSQDLQAIRFSKLFDTAASGVGFLLIHYDVPKVDADGNVYIALRDRVGPNIVYSVQKLDTSGSVLWTYPSDYHNISAGGWEGTFSFALGNGYLYVAGLYGIVHVISPDDGSAQFDVVSYPIPDPIPAGLATGVVESGPEAIDGAGTLYYVVRSTFDGVPSHLAKVTPDGTVSTVNFADLTGQAESPGLNCGPAIAPDGTIYVATVHSAFPISQYSLLAINPDLSLKWIGNLASDSAHVAQVNNQSTSTPVVGPDGRVFYGGWNSNEQSDGYLYEFSPDGTFLGEYPFGWDTTPVIYPDPMDPNHYFLGEKKNMYTSRRFFWVWIDPDGMTEVASWELMPSGTDELCVNAGVVDANLNTFFLGENGILYKVPFMSSTASSQISLGAPRNAAYTPTAMGPDGTIFALDDRSFYIVGNSM